MPIRTRTAVLASFAVVELGFLFFAPRLWWLPLVFAIAVFAVGMTIRARVELEGTVTIDRPLPEVWGFVTDPAHIPLWNTRIVDVRLDEPLPLRVGSTYGYAVEGRGRRIACHAEVLERKDLEMQRTRARIGPILSIGTHRFEADGERTRLTAGTVAEVPYVHALVMRSVGRERLRADLARLKAAVEEGTAL